GHTSEQTTRIYLASLENSIIDDANRGILEGLK
ncbi:MAG: site-specific integrase, partial [Bacteroidales bacterium]|nr:site-specific integrase [Bacteroidales bacterium]